MSLCWISVCLCVCVSPSIPPYRTSFHSFQLVGIQSPYLMCSLFSSPMESSASLSVSARGGTANTTCVYMMASTLYIEAFTIPFQLDFILSNILFITIRLYFDGDCDDGSSGSSDSGSHT